MRREPAPAKSFLCERLDQQRRNEFWSSSFSSAFLRG